MWETKNEHPDTSYTMECIMECESQKNEQLLQKGSWGLDVSHENEYFFKKVSSSPIWVTKNEHFLKLCQLQNMSNFSCKEIRSWARDAHSEIFRKPQNAPTLTVIRPDRLLYVRPAKGRLWPILYKRLKIVLQTADVVFLRGAVIFCFLHCVKSCRFSSNAIKTGSLSNKGRVYRTGVAWDCNQL